MDVLIVGDGEEERAWADWLSGRPEYEVIATVLPRVEGSAPGPGSLSDLNEGLAIAGLELAIIGGPVESRGEVLRRAAAEGLAIICLHPPGDDSESYYQVALSRAETGAVIVPDLPLRRHPGVERLRRMLSAGELGEFRGLRLEVNTPPGERLATRVFPTMIDVIRSLLGTIDSLIASGDPPGSDPDQELVVQLRDATHRRAEVRLVAGPPGPTRLTLSGSLRSVTLELGAGLCGPSSLIHRDACPGMDSAEHLGPWDPKEAIGTALREAMNEGPGVERGSTGLGPSLLDGTRAMELSEAVVRSLRKGRTIDLHYEEISEEAVFKSIMTSTGCMLLLSLLLVLPVSLAGPAIGLPGTIYLAYAILPALVLFALFQFVRLGIRTGSHDDRRRTQERPRTSQASRM
ncbi:hypothetical protein OJF2_20650 [Aquisphaera giovannonii]|uniref:Uncharacterized protein n=1 Tax=Aquisphaera giovannonii TaxID=406548 RepID=A0A5B9VYY3_9BACT|nr:hypothetical protein [Aquisphaera giovannonii]QEH33563.1 hypothetical protein OJF2_20650 [Aquisphaera giovannonii]